MRREKIKFLHKRETTAIGKSFMQNQIKSRNIILHTSINFHKTSTLNNCDGGKQIYPKKQKKILREDILQISETVVRGVLYKHVLKNFATCLSFA